MIKWFIDSNEKKREKEKMEVKERLNVTKEKIIF